MSKLKYLSEDKILTIKNNKKVVLEHMSSSIDNAWLSEFFREDNPFNDSKINFNDLKLKTAHSQIENEQLDLDNAIYLHKNLHLTESQACDERIWISLCFGQFYDYMINRWEITEYNLKTHWLFPHGQKRSLFYNGISKLYWFAKLTHDDSLQDPYELTKFCFSNMTVISHMFYRGYVNSKTVRLGIIKAVKDFLKDGGTLANKMTDEILKYVSFFGGAYLLDSFTEQQIYDKVYFKLIELYIREFPDQKVFKL